MTILDQIVETKRGELVDTKKHRSVEALHEAVLQVPPPRDFFQAVTSVGSLSIQLIAEVKKASPSAGLIVREFDPVAIARICHQHGAAAISVLTDPTYFQGRLEYIAQIKQAVPLPVLRKDFILEEYQVVESRAGDADAVLLIAEVLDIDTLAKLVDLSANLGMTSVVEVHTEENLLSVLNTLGPPGKKRYIPGMNNRDLTVQLTDLKITGRLAKHLPLNTPFISESGITSRKDVLEVQQAGACAILVGESILRANNIGEKIDELLGK